jgi:hypothetical protein
VTQPTEEAKLSRRARQRQERERHEAEHVRSQAWKCYRCREVVLNADLFIVGNQTGEAVVLHRACVTSLLSPLKRSLGLHSQTPSSRPQNPAPPPYPIRVD